MSDTHFILYYIYAIITSNLGIDQWDITYIIIVDDTFFYYVLRAIKPVSVIKYKL